MFAPEAGQQSVFEECKPLISSVLDGHNVCIFAYGQTGSGKTYTLGLHASVFTSDADEGNGGAAVPELVGMAVSDEQESGLVERALRFYMQRAAKRQEGYGMAIQISLCMLEIYNDVIRDLLRPKPTDDAVSQSASDNATTPTAPLELRTENNERSGGNKGGTPASGTASRFRVYCDGATWVNLNDETDAAATVRRGVLQRVTGTTARNQVSSRTQLERLSLMCIISLDRQARGRI